MSINFLLRIEEPEGAAERSSIRPIGAELHEQRRDFSVSIIVAAARDGAIGRQGGMIWHLPADLKHFKNITSGHTVIMGRRTFESLPKGALPRRRNIVVSRNPLFRAEGAEVFASLDDALRAARADGEVFIIGGAQIYKESMPIATRLYLTRIDAEAPDADAFFPDIDPARWQRISQSEPMAADGVTFRFEDYVKSAR